MLNCVSIARRPCPATRATAATAVATTKVRRKGNTVAEKLEQDRASLEALGLVVPGQANSPPPSTATSSTPTAPGIDVAAATTSSSAAAASSAAAPPSVELLARMVGEVLRGDQAMGSGSSIKVQKKEDRVHSSILGGGGVSGAATASATSRIEAGGGSSGAPRTAGQQQQQLQQQRGVGGDPAIDLICMDDLLEGWTEDEVPARWPSLTPSSEQPGTAVTVLCSGRIGRQQPWAASSAAASSSEEAAGNASVATTPAGGGGSGADVAATTQQVSDGGLSNGAGGTGAPGQNDPEAAAAAAAAAAETVGTPGPKRLSFRRPSTSSLGVSKTVSRSHSSSSFTLPTRLGRWAPKAQPVQVEDAVAVEVGGAGDDAANKGRSPSPPPPPPPSSLSLASSSSSLVSSSGTMRPLESLLPDSRELRAPPPPPLPPPLPHKAEMWLVDPASSSSSSASSSGAAGGGGGNGGGVGSGGVSTTAATTLTSLASLPSFSSLLASAQGGRGGAAAHAASAANAANAAAGHGESAGVAALGGGGGGGGGSSVSAAAETVGEPQHMDQLFDLLELDLGIGGGGGDGGREAGTELLPGTTTDGNPFRWRASVLSGEAAAAAGVVWGSGDGVRNGLRGAEWGGESMRPSGGRRPSAFGGGFEAAVDYNASLWHILQVCI